MIINDSVYGEIRFTGAIEQIIQSRALQRLRKIHQGGAVFLAYPNISTSRLEHSWGVCYLIRLLGGDEREQIAGLLHDLSHTAFSHIIDYVLENKEEDFHEKHKLRFLLDRELGKILRSLGLEPEEFVEDNRFSLLETELPALCADRIDYTLRDLIAWGKISQIEARQFLDSLRVVDGVVTINSIAWGQWFKNNYEYLNQYFFQDAKNTMANCEFTKLLQSALEIDVVKIEDFFQDDNFIINKINSCKILKDRLELIKVRLENRSIAANTPNFKRRIVDPLILKNDCILPLSKLAEL